MPKLPDSSKTFNCREMLQKILDGDATPEQQQQFKVHMEECMPCYKGYELEMAIKALLQKKCNGHGAPPDLIEKIKNKISHITPH
ncbi:MAG: mycothiol system anti-sigma-R factor [Cyclobacteriaceae bacterium]|nr:mycothiol system anti-sigma-R factor [Cyclobacteriaceae bacterium]